MKSCLLVTACLMEWSLIATLGFAQERPARGGGTDKSILQRFDANGDGQIDDEERRAVRSKLQQMQNKPGARTPSGETETVGNRWVTEMQYPSSDGQLIPCVLSIPKGDGPFPMLVTIHGGQGNRDLGYIRSMAAPNALSPTISAFNEQPWAILAISYRAGNGALFGMEQDDVLAGIRFAKSLPKIDPNRIGVVGGSHGGHLALIAAEKMGRELLCVAVGSPWMTDPVVYMTGDPNKPPLSKVPAKAREDLIANGQRIFNGMKRGRQMSDQQILEFIGEHSIEANADKIVIPTLFVTSRGDDQAPHVLIEPMIEKMKAAKKEVQVYTAEKSPHGFYWARTVSAARDLRGAKTPEEEQEELISRRTMIEFFTTQFARNDAKTEQSPAASASSSASESRAESSAGGTPALGEADSQSSTPIGRGVDRGVGRGGAMTRGGLGTGRGGADFKSIAGNSEKITQEAFKKYFGGSAALASRPEIIDQLFTRLDTDGDGTLSESEFEAFSQLRSKMGQGGSRSGIRGGGGAGASPARQPKATNRPTGNAEASPVAEKTAALRIASGELVGEQRGDVRVFRGVPYAAAPVGNHRWREALPAESWTGTRDATRFGATALQSETFKPRSAQSEDCLFLNVWSPANADEKSKLPVLVWIHGGAFIQGSGDQPRYDGAELARRGAVVITINYRLGPMGLFAHPALTAESRPGEPLGNYCLLDMIAALRWTHDNITSFGGDPGNVTISGSSAGGTSCLFLMGVPQAEGLFHKAIIHSSGGIKNIQTLAEAEAAGLRLAEHLGLDSKASPAELRQAAAGEVAVGVGVLRELNLPVKPIIDGRLVKATPSDLFAQGKQARIPVLIGGANGESGARQLSDEVATGGAFGFQRELAEQMQRVGQPVWMFQLTYVPPQSRASRFAAQHGESVAYAFGTIGQSMAAQYGFRNEQVAAKAMQSRRGGGAGGVGAGREDDSRPVEDSEQGRKISAAMMDYWLSFMRDGQPSGKQLPTWPMYQSNSQKVMVFGNEGIAVH
jgi:para-nitrobenzyl esterase